MDFQNTDMAHRPHGRGDDLALRDGLRHPYTSLVDETTSTILMVIMVIIFTFHRC